MHEVGGRLAIQSEVFSYVEVEGRHGAMTDRAFLHGGHGSVHFGMEHVALRRVFLQRWGWHVVWLGARIVAAQQTLGWTGHGV